MANFEKAIIKLLDHEGGYTEDHAGATHFGITLRSLDVDIDFDGDVDADDIRAMTIEDAKTFYRRRWWNQYKYDRINSDRIAEKVFDLAVNMGSRQAAKIIQRSLRALHRHVKIDGVLGPNTRAIINDVDEKILLASMRSEAAGFYRELIARKPKFERYRKGWLNRAYA